MTGLRYNCLNQVLLHYSKIAPDRNIRLAGFFWLTLNFTLYFNNSIQFIENVPEQFGPVAEKDTFLLKKCA